MYIWSLKQIGEVGYDENEGFVICAETSPDARRIAFAAAEEQGAEVEHVWLNHEFTDIEAIGEATLNMDGTERKPGLIMRSFNRG